MISDIPPLDDDLSALLRRERLAEPFPPSGARERSFDNVMKRVAAAEALANAPPAAPATPSASTRLLAPVALSMLALGLLLGAIAATFVARDQARVALAAADPKPQIVYVPVEVPIGYPAYLPATATGDDAITVQDAPKPKPSAPQGDRLAAERRLLDGARVALASGEPGDALRLAERHRAEFPGGVLVEEREAIATKALVEAHRPAEARARGAAFERRFPESPMLRSVRSSLASLEAKP